MIINFVTAKESKTRTTLFWKQAEEVPKLPEINQALRLPDDRIARVLDIEYYLSQDRKFAYDKIDVLIEVYEKEAVSVQPT